VEGVLVVDSHLVVEVVVGVEVVLVQVRLVSMHSSWKKTLMTSQWSGWKEVLVCCE
jgi:hypothetical protein